MVLFLFVIMLLGAAQTGQRPFTWWNQPLALFLGFLLLLETAYLVLTQRNTFPAAQALPADFGSPASIGGLLFQGYLLPFEITSVLLLVSMVGVIVLSLGDRRKRRQALLHAGRRTDGRPVEALQEEVKPVELTPTEMGEPEEV